MAIWFNKTRNIIPHLTKISPLSRCNLLPKESILGSFGSPHFLIQRFETIKAEKQLDSQSHEAQNEVLDFPGGQVMFTSKMKIISESPERRTHCYRVLDENGQIITDNTSIHQVCDKEVAVKMYRYMTTLQIMDAIFYEAQRQGRISFYLTTLGEEAINIASAAALSMDDLVFPQVHDNSAFIRGYIVIFVGIFLVQRTMRKKTPKEAVVVIESNRELKELNKMISKQLVVTFTKLRTLASFDSDERFADAIEDEVEIGEKKIAEKMRLEEEFVMEDSKKFDGDGLKMKHLEETTEREVHRAIDLVGGKDGDMSESSRSNDNEEVVTLMREVHMINDSNRQEAQPTKPNPNSKALPRIR
ncbi:hypothetical protein GIB67_031925 [Kingdonia uniflora]|uniref:Dehydrogenase E1 component domain-containing protein n=1 Tax=Kingdonia uniflora TaxID=39325 RepID=A0A7J7NTI5_9MAGN|nr:hypothetical protein GIB67_031925 [Kingdonia uniflora]